MCAHKHAVLDILNLLRAPNLSVCAMAAREAAALLMPACFGRSTCGSMGERLLHSGQRMVKQEGSETAENDGSMQVNVAHPQCQLSLPGHGCYRTCRRHHNFIAGRGVRDDGDMF